MWLRRQSVDHHDRTSGLFYLNCPGPGAPHFHSLFFHFLIARFIALFNSVQKQSEWACESAQKRKRAHHWIRKAPCAWMKSAAPCHCGSTGPSILTALGVIYSPTDKLSILENLSIQNILGFPLNLTTGTYLRNIQYESLNVTYGAI